MNFEQMEQRFRELKEQRETGEIGDEQFIAEVEKLQFQDRQGRLWRIGASTGRWYYEEEGHWVEGKPPRGRKVPSKTTAVVLLLIGGVFVVIALIMAGVLPGSEWIPGLVTPATATVALATNTATPSPTATPTPTPIVVGKIAFPVFDPERETYDIFIANTDGTGQKKIKEEASQPCLSPDGTQIAYRSWRSDKRGLIMADISGNDLWIITTSHEASRPSVSRVGIAYHLRQAAGSPAYIYLPRGNGEPEVIRYGDQLQPLSGESPAWMPGERLVYKGYVKGSGLYLTEGVYDGTGITQITGDISDTNPEASPDGKKVAFMSRRDVNWEIYVVDLESYTVERLTKNGASDGLPVWSPDGRTIAFVSDRSGEWAVWVMDSDGSNQRMLFPLGGSPHGYVQDAPPHERGGWEEERLSWSP